MAFFDDLPGNIWIDGEFFPWKEAKVHVMTHGLHYASSVYEGLRAYNGRIFKAYEHYKRLIESAKYLGFDLLYSADELMLATQQLIYDCNYKNPYIRAIAWVGSESMLISTRSSKVHIAIAAWEREVVWPDRFLTEGINMHIADWRRPDPKTAPVHSKASCMYTTSSMAKAQAESEGFDDALMLGYDGNIAEATTSNIFFIKKGELYTPKPECFLNGITRRTCIQIAAKLGINVNETTMSVNDLDVMTESFITGTAIEILPVSTIHDSISYHPADFKKVYKFTPGSITEQIIKEFRKMTGGNI